MAALLENAWTAAQATHPDEDLKSLNEALIQAASSADKQNEALARFALSVYYANLGQNDKATASLARGRDLLKAEGDKAMEATVLAKAGQLCIAKTGQWSRALEFYQLALPLYRAAGDKGREAATLDDIGTTLRNMSRFPQAMDYFEQARTRFHEVGNLGGEAQMWHNLGVLYRDRGEPNKALDFLMQALTLSRTIKYRAGEASTLRDIAETYRLLGAPEKVLEFSYQALALGNDAKPDSDRAGMAWLFNTLGNVAKDINRPLQATKYFEQARILYHELNDTGGEAQMWHDLGRLYWIQGQPGKALDYYQQALPLRRQSKNKAGEAWTLNEMAQVYLQIGLPQKALNFFNQALPLQTEAQHDVTWTLNHMGQAYSALGQWRKALEFNQRALSLHHASGEVEGEIGTLESIGSLYQQIGNNRMALEFYTQSASLSQASGRKSQEGSGLNGIAIAYATMGQFQKAVDFYGRALELVRETGPKFGEIMAMLNLGDAYQKIGQLQKALDLYDQALPLAAKISRPADRARALRGIGINYKTSGQSDKALACYQQALALCRSVEDKVTTADLLGKIAAIEETQGRLDDAAAHASEALTMLEAVRESLGALAAEKVSFLEGNLNIYHVYVNVLAKQGKVAEAFNWVEKTKARALLDLMDAGKMDLAQGMSDEERQRERELQWQASQLNQRLVAEATKANPDKAQLSAIKEQMARAESDLQIFRDALYTAHPDLATKRAARTVTIEDVPQFLPADTVLLDYAALKATPHDKVVLFCATTEQGKATVQAYEIQKSPADLIELLDDFRRSCTSIDSIYASKARELYMLLIAPAASQLVGKRHLVICPDGPLWGLPFQALRVRSEANGDEQFLMERYSLSYAYSATAVRAALRLKASPQRVRPNGILLALANPDFGGPERFAQYQTPVVERPITAGSRPLTAGSRSPIADAPAVDGIQAVDDASAIPSGSRDVFTRDGGIKPLPGTQREADALKATFPDGVIDTGTQAQEMTAKQEAAKFRYLHFATHGLFNDTAPMLSSVVLAKPPAGSLEDGFLTAHEIFDLNWNADLVVLSACNTARGEKRSGEGVVGLTWALFVAGAPTQIVSQWAVDDASTAELMRQLYAHLKQGAPTGAALRSAELALLKDGEHDHPYYWAPFILMGDWSN